jgi:hypothetical protein
MKGFAGTEKLSPIGVGKLCGKISLFAFFRKFGV